jgi:ABC-type multidrug transport system fused ATPase/permease subunit
MNNALKDAQLHSLISTKTDHQSKGVMLSGGERQRVCIARALYHQEMRGGILLLDEFTSHLDAKNEAHVVDSLFSRIKTQGASAIIVAHRLATVQRCDEILVMNHGEITERGTHQQLLANKGWYAEMWRIQNRSGSAKVT